MQLKLTTDYQKSIYHLRLKYPSWSQQQLADELNVSQSLVANVDKKRKIASLIQVPELVKKRAYQSFEESSDRIEMYLTELEGLKQKKKEIITTDEEGTPKKLLITQSPTEITNIIKTQIDTTVRLNELRTLEEPMKILDWIGSHKLSEVSK